MNKKLFVILLSLLGTGTAAIMVSGIKLLSQDLNPFHNCILQMSVWGYYYVTFYDL